MPNTLPAEIQSLSPIYGPLDIVLNIALGAFLGWVVALVYRVTHQGLSYSQSFTHTLVYVATVVAMVMMVIGNSLTRAFALVGALSIIRFRTVVKDTKDTAFVFMALAVGMAAGTSNYVLATIGAAAFALLATTLFKSNFGSIRKSDLLLRFVYDQESSSADYLGVINRFSRRSTVLHIEPSADGKYLSLTYDVSLREGESSESLIAAMGRLEGISEVSLIAAKHDIDF